MNGRKEQGDYQTPLSFTDEVCRFLRDEKKVAPGVIIEPTCGKGHFIKSSLIFGARHIYGVEVNEDYCQACRKLVDDERVSVVNANFFTYDFPAVGKDELLVLGNPPWVNNSTLAALGSDNLPDKSNFKGLKGYDAMTGSSNFDICEYMIEALLCRYQSKGVTIAMLCKTSVARNVFEEMRRARIGCDEIAIYEFDAARIFSINASACLLYIKQNPSSPPPVKCEVYDFERRIAPRSAFGYREGVFYSRLGKEEDDFNGSSCFEWRQGVKHDCAKIMELTKATDRYENGNCRQLDLEDSLIYPLVKSSMFKSPVISSFTRYVIVTQRKAGDSTEYIREYAPKLWSYLWENKESFDKRKSVIYAKGPQFAMFGVGDYTFSAYKVGVSGFYKTPLFSLLSSKNGKPVMTDDTGYYICFETYDAAYAAMLYLNSDRVQRFLTTIAFIDSKRPYTKKVLSRLDFGKITSAVSFAEVQETERRLKLSPMITQRMVDDFRNTVKRRTMSLL